MQTPEARPQLASKITPPTKQIVAASDDASKWKMVILQDGGDIARAAPNDSPTPKTGHAVHHSLLHLPHPRHGERALFMLVNDNVLEMRRARRSEYACWFVGDRCESEGDVLFGTKMDPLFLALPALEKARNRTSDHAGRFQSKEQIFAGWAETCDEAMRLASLSAMNLEVICDVQDVGGDLYYRLNDDKVVAWASSKVSVILGFKYPDLDVARWKQLMGAGSDDGSTAGLTREEQIKKLQDADKAKSDKDRVIFGTALVADYLPVAWAGKLCEAFHLSVADLDARTRRPAPSSQPVGLPEGFSLPTEFSHKRPMNADKNDAKKQKTDDAKKPAAKAQTKVELFAKKGLSTKGMSSMASFFKPQAKAK